ncbi:MAG: hypothetical protein ABEH81_09245 [Halopenitus sp.]
MTLDQQYILVLYLLGSVISAPIVIPLVFGTTEAQPPTTANLRRVQIRQVVAYIYLFSAGMALLLRLGGVLELVGFFYLLLDVMKRSKQEPLEVENSIIGLLSGVDSNSTSFAFGFLILTGVYLGTQTLSLVSLQTTLFYTVFKIYTEFKYVLYYLLPLIISVFLASVVPLLWLQISNSATNFKRISGLYGILLLQLSGQLWLGTYIDSPAGTATFSLQNPNIFSVLLAGCIIGYAFLRDRVEHQLGASIFAVITIISLGSILADYSFLSDVNVLVWCAASYWFPPYIRILGRAFVSKFESLQV